MSDSDSGSGSDTTGSSMSADTGSPEAVSVSLRQQKVWNRDQRTAPMVEVLPNSPTVSPDGR